MNIIFCHKTLSFFFYILFIYSLWVLHLLIELLNTGYSLINLTPLASGVPESNALYILLIGCVELYSGVTLTSPIIKSIIQIQYLKITNNFCISSNIIYFLFFIFLLLYIKKRERFYRNV